MMRFVPVTLLVVLTASGVAHAQTTLPDGSTINFDKVYLHENGSEMLVEPDKTPESLWNYFNLAHCQCGKAAPDFVEATYGYLLTLTGVTQPNPQTLELWVGSACDADDANRMTTCRQLKDQGVAPISSITATNGVTREIPVYDAMNPESTAGECAKRVQTATVWAIADGDGNGSRDFFVSKSINTDSQPPSLPSGFRAAGGDRAIQITWTAPQDTTDTYAYQALCARAADDTPGRTSGRPTQRYMTALNLCGGEQSIDLMGTAITADPSNPNPMPVDTLPSGLKNLDPTFLCGENFSQTATDLRIEGLVNDVPYKVVLIAVDKFQNATGTFFTSTVTPVPSIDFWEDLHDRKSGVQGGLCTVARSGDHGPLTSALCLAAAVWLARRRRRVLRRMRVGAGAGIAVVLGALALAPGRAHAGGGGYQPYWETSDPIADQQQAVAPDASLVTWHAGIRVGPYTPAIDDQVGGSPGPYEQMFGGSRFLPMLDVDRILWTGFGQVGVGISLGYMQKSARTFTIESDPTSPNRERAGDKNTFRLIPMALTATYRFTMLDDVYGIPVVPYVRGGLAYYLWWVSVSGGGLAAVCTDGGKLPDCSKDRALGGSLGLQGSIGLAIRAERVDPSTAMSMQQSGILHAGIYGELSIANVDGFGSDKKLSVGDRTWFAGVNFEF